MQLFFKFAAFLLLAVWLPVTQHCDLEAAGLVSSHDADTSGLTCCEEGSDPCTHDGCELVENGTYNSASPSRSLPTPHLLAVCSCFIFSQLSALEARDEPVLPVAEVLTPSSWVPVWHFVRRAAPLSRAPSVLV
ncbi:MAG: hypothetical protein WC205_00205 [Opitutaceae bacterium]